MALDDMNDDDTDTDSPSPDSPVIAPVSGGSSVNPAVAAYLQKLQAAQDQVKQNQQASGLTSALVQLGHGLSRAQGPADLSAVQAMAKNDNAPVQNFQSQQQGAQQAMQMQAQQEASDPNSVQSQRLRAVYQPLLKRAGLDPAALEGLSANEIKTHIQQPLEAANKQQTLESNKQLQYKSLNDKASERSDDKKSAAQDKAVTDFYSKDMTFRGNKAVQNANEALRNSDQAMQIINSNPDYNKISPTMYNLLTAEVAKIATGGAASEGASNDTRVKTLQSQAANFWQSVSGHPTGAQLGEFIQQNKEYLQGLNEINHRYVDNYRAENFRGHQRLLPDEEKATYLANNPGVAEILKGKAASDRNPQSDTVLIKDPQGNVRKIPAAQKQAALDAGGTLAQ